jgi:hypothetical protein
MLYRIPSALMVETFDHLRRCGLGAQECQLLWISAWSDPSRITRVVHPRHRGHAHGFELDGEWLNEFWLDLARAQHGIRVQVHSHPFEAFHSEVDDQFPIVHSSGFLSLVIPKFGTGPIGFAGAYLTEIQLAGCWQEVPVSSRLEVIR